MNLNTKAPQAVNTKLNTVLTSGTKVFEVSNNETALFIGLELEFPKVFKSTLDIHLYFVDTYFDIKGSGGHYWLMAESFKELVVGELGYSQHDMLRDAIDASTQFHSDKTVVQILLRVNMQEELKEECGYVESEMTEYLSEGYITHFKQFSL